MLILLVLLFGCLLLAGCISGPPTTVERLLFVVRTNYVEEVVTQTNLVNVRATNWVTVPLWTTNNVSITNLVTIGKVVTNQVEEIVTVTNLLPSYEYQPGAGENAVKTGAGLLGNVYGVGGLAVGALGVLFGEWRRRRAGVQKPKA